MHYGLIGRNISYSFSERYFTEKFNERNSEETYRNFDIDTIEQLDNVLRNNDLSGFNVTIPFKEEIFSFLDHIDEVAKEIGAVNCVKIRDKKLIGHNTDAYGFEESLKPLLKPGKKEAIIFGDGGAAKAVKFVLNKLEIPYKIVTRNGDFKYSDLKDEDFNNATLIVNTTPVGTFPNIEESLPINFDFLNNQHLVYDLIYNPEKTKLLKEAQNNGAIIKNGLEMLELQAELSYEIWNA